MNKQEKEELITFVNRAKEDLNFSFGICQKTYHGYVQGNKLINYIEHLYEPQKVKVPACVAEYIEAHRKWGPEIFIGDWLADNDAVYKWLYNNSEKENNRRFLIAVKAFVEGYEVEEEPKWVVKIEDNGSAYFVDFFDELQPHLVCGLSGEVMRFDSEDKANAIVTLIECGTVEKV